MIKYIGSKRTLVPVIQQVVRALCGPGSMLDLFSGTSRVGHGMKSLGYRVVANDHNAYAATLGRCYVQADAEDHARPAEALVREFNRLPGRPGYFTDVFCERSRFFQPKNGARIDAIREEIERRSLDPELRAVMLVSLMEAADRVDSTTGVQMAYLKGWAPRSFNDLELRVPNLLPRAAAGKGEAWQLEAAEAARRFSGDVVYIDPPYNQHKYLGNYHIWESLVLWDKPEVYGIACKRIDCRDRGSAFNSKPAAPAALQEVLAAPQAPHLVVSFNNEGYFTRDEIEAMLKPRGEVLVIEQDFKRYVGAQIGIHNLQGEKVGEVSHLRNTEYLYVVSDPASIERVREALLNADATDVPAPPAPNPEPAPPRRPPDADLPGRLAALLCASGTLTSGQAQKALDADPTQLREAFKALVQAGDARVSGQTRGTRYHWSREEHRAATVAQIRLPWGG